MNQTYMERWGENEDHDEVRNDEGEGENRIEATFGFPILDTVRDVNMKNILPPPYLFFIGRVMNTQTHFCSSLTSSVEVITIYKTPIN